MKSILVLYALILFSFYLSGCKCEHTNCLNGGICENGTCICPPGYSGENCEIKDPIIGDPYQGGIIFYIDNSGDHGLIAAINDQSSSAIWGCEGTDIPGAANVNIGAGQDNTNAIVNGCVGPNAINTAARVCDDLSLGGFDDWFLPSIDELNLLYQQRNIVKGFAEEVYWSSSQSDPNSAWRHNFATNSRGGHLKSISNRVRAIRAF